MESTLPSWIQIMKKIIFPAADTGTALENKNQTIPVS